MSAVIKRTEIGIRGVAGVFIIDNGSAPEIGEDVEEFETVAEQAESAEEKAQAIVEEAKATADKLIADALRETEDIHDEAYQAGYDAGFKEFEARTAAFDSQAAELEKDVQQQVEESWHSLEPEIVKLSIDIARRIIREEISLNQDIVLGMVREGISQLRERQQIRVHVNPADYETMRSHKDEIAGSFDGMRSMEITEDRRVAPGGCLIETSNGDLDARVDTQLAEVERVLLEEIVDGAGEATTESEQVS